MSDKHNNLRDKIGQAISDYAAEHTNPDGTVGIDWCSSRDIDPLADIIVALINVRPETSTLDELALRLMRRVEEKKEQFLSAWLAQTGIMPTDAVLFTCNDYVHGQLRQKFWVERKPPVPDFEAVKDKRMSEMTEAQKDDAMELWLRTNLGWFGMGGNDAGRHMAFLIKRLDEARGVK